MIIRKASSYDSSKRLASAHRKQLGFVISSALAAAVERGELLEAVDGAGNVVGFCHFHLRRDGWHTIYEIASVSPGAGTALLTAIPSPKQLKCPVDLPANEFYRKLGGTLVSTLPGRKRALNVWKWSDNVTE